MLVDTQKLVAPEIFQLKSLKTVFFIIVTRELCACHAFAGLNTQHLILQLKHNFVMTGVANGSDISQHEGGIREERLGLERGQQEEGDVGRQRVVPGRNQRRGRQETGIRPLQIRHGF